MPTSRNVLAEIEDAEKGYPEEVLSRHEALRTANDFSENLIAKVRAEIAAAPPPTHCNVHVLATAGSLARREASEQSDLDLMMTTHPVAEGQEEPDVEDLKGWRDAMCDRMGIEKPNKKGVFADPTCRSLMEGISGGSEERYQDVAKRALFILESEWLHNEEGFLKLLDDVVGKYAEMVVADPRKNFVFLVNDIIRYFRQLCVNYQYTTSETPDGRWPIRNIKLRHSRVMMYFSMIAALGALSPVHDGSKIEALKALIRLPPLRRLHASYKLSGDEGFSRVAGPYNTFLHLLSQKEARDGLGKLEYVDRYSSPIFSQLKANSDALSAELLRFFDARRGSWDERFFEYMLL